MSAPPPYNTKIDESMSSGNYQQRPHFNPNIQEVPSQPIGNPMMGSVGDLPIPCTCPRCQQSIVTRIQKHNGLMVWLIAGLLCFFGCFLGCCLIPFCINDLKDTTHYCPNCNTIIAQHKKL